MSWALGLYKCHFTGLILLFWIPRLETEGFQGKNLNHVSAWHALQSPWSIYGSPGLCWAGEMAPAEREAGRKTSWAHTTEECPQTPLPTSEYECYTNLFSVRSASPLYIWAPCVVVWCWPLPRISHKHMLSSLMSMGKDQSSTLPRHSSSSLRLPLSWLWPYNRRYKPQDPHASSFPPHWLCQHAPSLSSKTQYSPSSYHHAMNISISSPLFLLQRLFILCFWERVSHWWLGSLTDLQRSYCLCLPSAVVTGKHHQSQLLWIQHGCWGWNLGPHAYSASTLKAISQASWLHLSDHIFLCFTKPLTIFWISELFGDLSWSLGSWCGLGLKVFFS